MSSTRSILLTVVGAFAGGFAAGVLYQTPSARRFRGSVLSSARTQAQWVEQRLGVLENQIHQLEGQLQQVGTDFSQKVKDTMGQYRQQAEAESWDVRVENEEVERELRRIPRS